MIGLKRSNGRRDARNTARSSAVSRCRPASMRKMQGRPIAMACWNCISRKRRKHSPSGSRSRARPARSGQQGQQSLTQQSGSGLPVGKHAGSSLRPASRRPARRVAMVRHRPVRSLETAQAGTAASQRARSSRSECRRRLAGGVVGLCYARPGVGLPQLNSATHRRQQCYTLLAAELVGIRPAGRSGHCLWRSDRAVAGRRVDLHGCKLRCLRPARWHLRPHPGSEGPPGARAVVGTDPGRSTRDYGSGPGRTLARNHGASAPSLHHRRLGDGDGGVGNRGGHSSPPPYRGRMAPGPQRRLVDRARSRPCAFSPARLCRHRMVDRHRRDCLRKR